ncbi:UNVERIFIED_CONTAM: hypothetical protein RMT77_004139 [Armadillidium vulgare]
MAYANPDVNYLRSIFQKVDRDGSGAIDARELQSALSNGNWTPFNPDTVKLMMGMFDRTGSNTISFNDFGALWKYVVDWQNCFKTYDRDNSGNISKDELKTALTTFGYRFSDPFYNVLMTRFDRSKRGQIYFDDFIQCCIVLHTLTQAFMQYDTDRDGVITIPYEQFLHLIFNARI